MKWSQSDGLAGTWAAVFVSLAGSETLIEIVGISVTTLRRASCKDWTENDLELFVRTAGS
jgi:hypothetical protein